MTSTPDRAAPELGEYAEAVLDVVDQVPPGSVTTYGRIARVLSDAGLGGGPRSVGAVMASHGGAVAWWRVLPADGSPPVCDPAAASARWREEGTPLRAGGRRVDLVRAVVEPVAPVWVTGPQVGPEAEAEDEAGAGPR
ncbi:MGMT family protein [Aquipuribacter sp. MA13-6]|uniref:MGMT family protein n=1 Tax=unclassified Aquipuribacter TaxID=2635084 RepID=UPI003EEEA9C7